MQEFEVLPNVGSANAFRSRAWGCEVILRKFILAIKHYSETFKLTQKFSSVSLKSCMLLERRLASFDSSAVLSVKLDLRLMLERSHSEGMAAFGIWLVRTYRWSGSLCCVFKSVWWKRTYALDYATPRSFTCVNCMDNYVWQWWVETCRRWKNRYGRLEELLQFKYDKRPWKQDQFFPFFHPLPEERWCVSFQCVCLLIISLCILV